jgi:hypothetical protein
VTEIKPPSEMQSIDYEMRKIQAKRLAPWTMARRILFLNAYSLTGELDSAQFKDFVKFNALTEEYRRGRIWRMLRFLCRRPPRTLLRVVAFLGENTNNGLENSKLGALAKSYDVNLLDFAIYNDSIVFSQGNNKIQIHDIEPRFSEATAKHKAWYDKLWCSGDTPNRPCSLRVSGCNKDCSSGVVIEKDKCLGFVSGDIIKLDAFRKFCNDIHSCKHFSATKPSEVHP